MDAIEDTIRRLLSPPKPIKPGSYHYQAPPDDPRNFRFHLRVEPDGRGILLINATTVLHLNQTAVEYAYYLVQGFSEDEVVKQMISRYRVQQDTARRHYRDFIERIETLVTIPDLDPVTFLDFDRTEPFSGDISAPYRLDCALTYTLPEAVAPEVAPGDRVERELSTVEWKRILDKVSAAGIPHVIFTGGEPTLREDLPELIEYAEHKNMVTGILTDGLKLANREYMDNLLQTGLDHLLYLLQSGKETSWKGLENALEADLFVAVHLTLSEDNRIEMEALVPRIARMGVKAVSLTASDTSLVRALEELREEAASNNLELVWNIPVPYSECNPVSLETEDQPQPEGAGRAWLYVEPDGDVLPTQGENRILGNLLQDDWEVIWSRAHS